MTKPEQSTTSDKAANERSEAHTRIGISNLCCHRISTK